MNNLHISLTDFRNESRVIKEVASLSALDVFDRIFIAAFHSDGLLVEEKLSARVSLNRFSLKTRRLNWGLWFKAIKYAEFVIRILIFYRKKNIGMVNVHALAVLPLGYLFKLAYGAKLIYDTHELETETNGAKGFKKKLGKWVESILIMKADHVFVVSESIADWYRDYYNIRRPTVVLNAPREQLVKKNCHFTVKFGLRKDQIIFLYQGALMPGRGVELILETFKKRTDDRIVMVFMGYGILEIDIQDASKFHKNIFFHEAVTPEKLLNYTVSADVGISLIENTCLSYYYCMPNKLFEFAMAGLPVVVSNMKDMRGFVGYHQMGVVVEDETTDSLNKAIRKLLCMDLTVLRKNATKAGLENAWETQEKKMQASYKKLLEII